MTEAGGRPLKVYVEPTNACNLACTTCVRHAWDEPEGFMEWATFEAVVDGTGPGGTVAFMGLGEPLLHPRFLEMVRLAKERGLRAEVTTNALLLDDVMAAGLLDAGLDQLVVSIDGANAESFGRVRSGASLDRVIENIRRLHDARGANYGPSIQIGVEFVAMRSNVGELPGLGLLAARLGADLHHREQRSGVHRGPARRDALRPPRELAQRRRDHRGPKMAAAGVDWDKQLGAALGDARTRLRSGLLLRRRARGDPQPLSVRRGQRLLRRLARRRQPLPKRTFSRLARDCHPDVNPEDPGAEAASRNAPRPGRS